MSDRREWLLIAFVLAAAAPGQGQAQAAYTITDVGPFFSNGGYIPEVPQAINTSGQVAGFSIPHIFGGNTAFLYSNGAVTNPPLFASGTINAINDAGQYAGGIVSGGVVLPFGPANAFVNIDGTVQVLSGYNAALGINASGQVVGGASMTYSNGAFAGDVGHAFLYSGGVTTDLGTLGGNSATAIAINNSGQIVGASNVVAGGALHAFSILNGTMTDLGTLGGSTSLALTVNAAGQIFGISTVAGDSTLHEFLYAGGRMTDLGSLGTTFSNPSSASMTLPFDRPFPAINDFGQLVGTINDVGLNKATPVLYSGGVMTDLNTLIDPASGWTLLRATAINDLGQIAGEGIDPNGDFHAFLLTPGAVPEPSSLILLGSGLVGSALAGRRHLARRSMPPSGA